MPAYNRLSCFVVLSIVLLAASCADDNGGAASGAAVPSAAQMSQRPALSGGDSQAWLTARGDLADSGYCDADLLLPLERTPDWVVQYSPAEFSRQVPDVLVHYDGQLLLTARSTLVMGLDVESGRQEFSRPLYKSLDRDAVSEEFSVLFGTPEGYLVARDDRGRHYCWDILTDHPAELWVGGETRTRNGYVANGTGVYTSYFEDVRRLDLLTGETIWEVPTLALRGGVVMGDEETVIWWSRESGKALALSAADGSQLWSYAGPDMVDRIVIDNRHSAVYMFLESELVQCRSLVTGKLNWEYSWYSEMEEETRNQYKRNTGWQGFYLVNGDASVLPDGLVFSLIGGQVFCLNLDGTLRWRFESQAVIRDMLAFKNGVMINEFYTSGQSSPWRVPLYAALCREEPQWSGITAYNASMSQLPAETEDPEQEEQRKLGFGRTTVLSLATGEQLDVFEPDLIPYSSMVPALNKVVFSEVLRAYLYTGRHEPTAPRKIVAYNWLDESGDS